jgi:3'-5' exoribonuclease
MFPEALLLHYLDDLDSKMEAMRAHFEREGASESPWTSYNASLGRPLLNTEKFLTPRKAFAPEDIAESAPEPPTPEFQADDSEKAPSLPGVDPRR